MKREDFMKIITSLNERIDICKYHFEGIGSDINFEDVSIKKIHEIIEFSKSENDIMTKIAMVDFYHIIGMGKLPSSQMSQFSSKMSEYLSYRPFIKLVIRSFKDLYDIPVYTGNGKYSLIALCDLELQVGSSDDAISEIASVEDYSSLGKPIEGSSSKYGNLPYCKMIDNYFKTKSDSVINKDDIFEIFTPSSHIRVNKEKSLEFTDHMMSLKFTFDFSRIKEYPKSLCGIVWIGENDEYYYGKIKTRAHIETLLK